MEATLWLGFGCRRGCSALELGALLFDVLQDNGLKFHQLQGIASIAAKADEAGLLTLATQLELELVTFTSAQLARYTDRLSHRSARAFAEHGCLGVAESAAMALAEYHTAGTGKLVVTRRHTPLATLAIASAVPPPRLFTSAT